MTQKRPEEEIAFKVVGQVLGVGVEPYDCCGRQNAVDAMLHYPGGRPDAALEISSLGPQSEARIHGVLSKRGHRRTVSGSIRIWYVLVPNDFAPAELDRIDELLLLCERLGLDHFPDQVPALMMDARARELWSRGVTASSISTTAETFDPRAYVHVRSVGGGEGEGIEPLADELFDHLRSPTTQSKVDKLLRTGLDELHLFLVVRPSAFSFPVYDALSFGGPLPSSPPRLPEKVSQVWLLSEILNGGVVRAVAGNAWLRDAVTDLAPKAPT